MDLGLDGKIVLVTGGSKGIGFACAESFHAEGARVAICSRAQANGERPARSSEAPSAPPLIAPTRKPPRHVGRASRARSGRSTCW